jgi:hypothetical protein
VNVALVVLALGLAGLWLNEQRRRRRAERETNVVLIELAEAAIREVMFRNDRTELIHTIQQLRDRGGDVAVVFPPGYLGGSGEEIDIRA